MHYYFLFLFPLSFFLIIFSLWHVACSFPHFFPHNQNGMVYYLSAVMIGSKIWTRAHVLFCCYYRCYISHKQIKFHLLFKHSNYYFSLEFNLPELHQNNNDQGCSLFYAVLIQQLYCPHLQGYDSQEPEIPWKIIIQ